MTHTTRVTSKPISITLLLFLTLLLGCTEDTAKPIDLAITNVTLIDAVNPARANQTVLVDQGRIIASGDFQSLMETSASFREMTMLDAV